MVLAALCFSAVNIRYVPIVSVVFHSLFLNVAGCHAIIVENRDSIGVIIGRVKREKSEDEACMSRLLDFIKDEDSCHVRYVASMHSNKSYKSSIEGFTVSVTIISSSESAFNSVLDLLSDYDVDYEVHC